MSTVKTDGFPRVRAEKGFKEQAYKACKENSVTYAQAVRILMRKLIEGTIKIDTNEDHDFEQNAKVALESESSKKAFNDLGEYLKNNPDRKYTNIKQA